MSSKLRAEESLELSKQKQNDKNIEYKEKCLLSCWHPVGAFPHFSGFLLKGTDVFDRRQLQLPDMTAEKTAQANRPRPNVGIRVEVFKIEFSKEKTFAADL